MTISDGNIASADDVLESIGNLTSQLAYEEVKSDDTNWTNTDYLGADEFTDSNGSKNTVDTSASDAFYHTNSDYYILGSTGTEDIVLDDFDGGGAVSADWTLTGTAGTGGGTYTEFNQTDYSGYLYGACTMGNEQNHTSNAYATYNNSDFIILGKTVIIDLSWSSTAGAGYTGAGIYIKLGGVTLFSRSGNGGSATPVQWQSTGTDDKVKIAPDPSNVDQVLVYLDTGGGYVLEDTIDISGRTNDYSIQFYMVCTSTS